MKLIELMDEMKHDNTTALGTFTHTHTPVQPIKSSYWTSGTVTEAPYLPWVAHSL